MNCGRKGATFKTAGGCYKSAVYRSSLLWGNMRKWGAGLKPADFIIFTQRVDGHI